MGQITTGVLYGCEVPDGVTRYDVFADLYLDGSTPLQFRTEPDSDKKLMGFFLLVAHPDTREHRGAKNIRGRSISIAGLRTSPEYRTAVESWAALSKWWNRALPHVSLPPPSLWLTPTEVA